MLLTILSSVPAVARGMGLRAWHDVLSNQLLRLDEQVDRPTLNYGYPNFCTIRLPMVEHPAFEGHETPEPN